MCVTRSVGLERLLSNPNNIKGTQDRPQSALLAELQQDRDKMAMHWQLWHGQTLSELRHNLAVEGSLTVMHAMQAQQMQQRRQQQPQNLATSGLLDGVYGDVPSQGSGQTRIGSASMGQVSPSLRQNPGGGGALSMELNSGWHPYPTHHLPSYSHVLAVAEDDPK